MTQEPQQPPEPAPAAQSYAKVVERIEQEHADDCVWIDGQYSRACQYAGLVRQELWNAAVERRTRRLAEAEAAYLGNTTQEVPHERQQEQAAGQ